MPTRCASRGGWSASGRAPHARSARYPPCAARAGLGSPARHRPQGTRGRTARERRGGGGDQVSEDAGAVVAENADDVVLLVRVADKHLLGLRDNKKDTCSNRTQG